MLASYPNTIVNKIMLLFWTILRMYVFDFFWGYGLINEL
jgi:hypothetical protein